MHRARECDLGRLALSELARAAEQAGFWKLLSRIFPENAASRALTRSLGFREVGIYEKHGCLDGVWRDVIIVELVLPLNQPVPCHQAMAMILGSTWTLALAALITILFLWRTALEDQTLRRELPGYEEYTTITRYRLMPGIW